MIAFSHVYKTYPGAVHALKNINFKIEAGEFVFLTGPSGAGKTTLFKMISAFDRISSGDLKVAGTTLADISANEVASFRQKIGVVFQDYRLIKTKTIFENVALPLEIRGEKKIIFRPKFLIFYSKLVSKKNMNNIQKPFLAENSKEQLLPGL